MNNAIKVLLIIGVLLLTAAAITFALRQKRSTGADTSSRVELADMKLTYVLSEETKTLYNITVTAGSGEQAGRVIVHGKACNIMNSTIQLLASNETTEKTVIKTLNDGRQVVEPLTASTMMACTDSLPEHDDKALNAAIAEIANSIQSL